MSCAPTSVQPQRRASCIPTVIWAGLCDVFAQFSVRSLIPLNYASALDLVMMGASGRLPSATKDVSTNAADCGQQSIEGCRPHPTSRVVLPSSRGTETKTIYKIAKTTRCPRQSRPRVRHVRFRHPRSLWAQYCLSQLVASIPCTSYVFPYLFRGHDACNGYPWM